MRSCAPQGAPPGGGTWWLSSEKEARSFHVWKTRGLRPKALSAPEWPWPRGAPTSPLGRAVGSALAAPYRAASWPRATCRREPPQTGRAVPLAVTAESPAHLPLEHRGPRGRGGLARVTQLSHAPGRWRGGGERLGPSPSACWACLWPEALRRGGGPRGRGHTPQRTGVAETPVVSLRPKARRPDSRGPSHLDALSCRGTQNGSTPSANRVRRALPPAACEKPTDLSAESTFPLPS